MTEYALYDEEQNLIRYVDKNTQGAVLSKQRQMFKRDDNEFENEYTSKIIAPIYEPKNIKPSILNLCDTSKYLKMINKINNSNLDEKEKEFLIIASTRFNVFNYELIADYYAHSNKDMQSLMEDLALVIIDFNKGIELGFVQLSKDIKEQYLEYYE